MKKVRMGNLKLRERENALNEIRILASIQDQNIIGYKEAFFDEQSNCLCVIMEYASGGDIAKLIQNSIRKHTLIEEKEIWKALIHMTRGLKVLHKAGILHRDLKSANVFKSSSNGIYKLGDMNVSKVSHGAMAKTQTGTPYYASPEVWRDQPYSNPSDVWSLGCVIYEMATLKPPFRATDLKSLFRKISAGIYEKIPKQYSQELNFMIASLLKVPPQLRPTCEQILNDSTIRKYIDELEPQSPQQQKLAKAQLLQTILLPKNLKQLQQKLPKPMYDIDQPIQQLPNQPKSTRSVSVNEQKYTERPKSQTPQCQKKQPNVISNQNIPRPKIPLAPVKQQQQLQQPVKMINDPQYHRPKGRPVSAMRAQSPCSNRKSVDQKQNQNPSPLVRKSNPYIKNNDENINVNIIKQKNNIPLKR
ncbi:unnamed protein product [Paramecium sonneborni]|uniref:non-specific serine/threonine protein kinase n=1 Tax=Paramecium sonneborni TaxID=65129 RepID=A0A8S1MEY0_9CILI|nr:unnamed protein product [Paramecium sonneborni]